MLCLKLCLRRATNLAVAFFSFSLSSEPSATQCNATQRAHTPALLLEFPNFLFDFLYFLCFLFLARPLSAARHLTDGNSALQNKSNIVSIRFRECVSVLSSVFDSRFPQNPVPHNANRETERSFRRNWSACRYHADIDIGQMAVHSLPRVALTRSDILALSCVNCIYAHGDYSSRRLRWLIIAFTCHRALSSKDDCIADSQGEMKGERKRSNATACCW